MQDRGVEVENRYRLLGDLVSEVIAPADDLAARNAAACHPDAEGVRIMIASDAALRNGHAAELGVPYHQRLVKHAAPFQVREQAGDGLVDLGRMLPVVVDDAVV